MNREGFLGSRKTAKAEESETGEKPRGAHLVSTFPQGEALLATYEQSEEGHVGHVETIRDALYTMLDKAIEHSELFRSEETGTEFPYTSIGLKEVAQAILAARGEPLVEGMSEEETGGEEKVLRQYLITSFPPNTETGSQFEWPELTMHEIVKALPQAVEDLRAGREPKDLRVYTLGFPTNDYGLMSEPFADELKQDAFGALAKLHTELIERESERERLDANAAIRLTGVSFGTSVAGEIAKKLIDDGAVTQEPGDKTRPHLSVVMYSPAGDIALSNDWLRKARVGGGFLAEGIRASRDPGPKVFNALRPTFTKEVTELLKDRMPARLDKEQKKLKRSGIWSMAKGVLKGVPVPKEVKVTEVIGLQDMLLHPGDRKEQVAAGKEEHPGALGAQLLNRSEDEALKRMFGVDMPHLIPFHRKREYIHFNKVAETIEGPGKDS